MGINRVQFQKGLSMATFQMRFGSEAQCEEAVERMRWPEGFRCPCCGDSRHTVFVRDSRRYWQCVRCRHQTSLRAGTIFENTKLPLTTWFLAIYLLSQSKNNVSALELRRILGVNYKAAWRLKHKLLEVMMQGESGRQLQGWVGNPPIFS